jgi:hypothetical protein
MPATTPAGAVEANAGRFPRHNAAQAAPIAEAATNEWTLARLGVLLSLLVNRVFNE